MTTMIGYLRVPAEQQANNGLGLEARSFAVAGRVPPISMRTFRSLSMLVPMNRHHGRHSTICPESASESCQPHFDLPCSRGSSAGVDGNRDARCMQLD